MRLVIQRVKRASVKVNNKNLCQIKEGLIIFLAVKNGDTANFLPKLVNKILKMRIFENAESKFDKSLLDIKGEVLIIPQFTLYADCSGSRPYFGQSAKPEIAKPLFDYFVNEFKKSDLLVEKGEFGAKMEIESSNDGPVTIILDSD